MKKITGKKLIKLGFKRKNDESDSRHPYHYYSYDVGNDCLLISNCSDERIEGAYEVEFFEISEFKFQDLKHLKKLVKLLKQVSNG